LYRLYAVLGQRTGSEQPPPRPEPPQRKRDGDAAEGERPENVIPLPGFGPRQTAEDAEEVAPASALDKALATIVSIDRSFDRESFLEGAAAAYEMIVTAFAAGDRRTLKPLLSQEVFDGFAHAIDERAAAGHVIAPLIADSA
ncbi:Tim44/TimA family putative adaptor protein, partial [Mycobacterium tuberculosis]|nr:Tim44/TimA family putative adaptor protein [Mycobacterium tuberculosis]